MSKLTRNDERALALARECMDRYHVALSVLAQGDNSPYMTDEFQQKLAEAEEKLAPYTVAKRAKRAEESPK